MITAASASQNTKHGRDGVALEIVVQDVGGARAAVAAGADRLELCSELRVGGLTPSAGLVDMVLEAVAGRPCTVQALVRSRPGGYVYSDDEVELMSRDIRALKAQGVHGVVVGALSSERAIDLFVLDRWMRAADGMPVTFHRALDVCVDPLGQLALLGDTGVGRVLTSGGAVRSIDGLALLESMVRERPIGIQVMAGGGVRLSDIGTLVRSGVDAVHLSAKARSVDSHLAGPGGVVQDVDGTNADVVARAHREITRTLRGLR